MKTKLKICFVCQDEKVIWKNVASKKYCLYCYLKTFPPARIAKAAKPIKPRSDKRAKQERLYAQNRVVFLAENTGCKANLSVCIHTATEIHHPEGRIGDLLNDKNNWLPVCRNCHDWIENHPVAAKEMGLSRSRLDKKEEIVFENIEVYEQL